MELIRGLVSALALMVWIGSGLVFYQNPTSGWSVFLVGLTTLVVVMWWHSLPDPTEKSARDGWGTPPVRKRENRFRP